MKTIKMGIFGLGRGSNFYKSVLANNGEVVAVCDKNESKFDKAREILGNDLATYTDFDEFIKHDMDAVFLANCFHEHAPFANRCL